MFVSRILHPIGQGAFYTELFEFESRVCNIVFDCGGTPAYIEPCVEKFCNHLSNRQNRERPIVDAVFISHFDDDHVNGLEKLFELANVKRIFLPLLNDSDCCALSLSFVEHMYNPLYIRLLRSAVNGETLEWNDQKISVIRIRKSEGENNRNEEDFVLDSDDDNNEGVSLSIASGTSVVLKKNIPWIFKTYNYDNINRERTLQLEEALEERDCQLSLDELLRCWSDNEYQEKIRECYDLVRGTINGNSMVTYSGPRSENVDVNCVCSRCCRMCFECDFCVRDLAGCMYFGDYEASGKRKWKQYVACFNNLIPLLQMQQVPHHGSKYNYNKLLNDPVKFNFISAGKSNRFRHPHNWTLNELNESCVPWVWIHEFSKSLLFEYDVRFD